MILILDERLQLNDKCPTVLITRIRWKPTLLYPATGNNSDRCASACGAVVVCSNSQNFKCLVDRVMLVIGWKGFVALYITHLGRFCSIVYHSPWKVL